MVIGAVVVLSVKRGDEEWVRSQPVEGSNDQVGGVSTEVSETRSGGHDIVNHFRGHWRGIDNRIDVNGTLAGETDRDGGMQEREYEIHLTPLAVTPHIVIT